MLLLLLVLLLLLLLLLPLPPLLVLLLASATLRRRLRLRHVSFGTQSLLQADNFTIVADVPASFYLEVRPRLTGQPRGGGELRASRACHP